MGRLAALALLFCAGCASCGSDNLVAESWFGDMRSLFNSSRPSVSSSAPQSGDGLVGTFPTVPKPPPSSEANGGNGATP